MLKDTWAIKLLGEKSRAEVRRPDHDRMAVEQAGFDPRPILAVGIGSLRYAEDTVEAAARDGFDQSVILGAGFDTFALRRGDLADRLSVFEVDYPDVQALKMNAIPYVSKEGTETTLRETLSCIAPGSRLVLNHASEVPLTDEQTKYLMTIAQNVSAQGEPMKSCWKP